MGMTYAFAGLSDVGRLRQNNEDSVLWDSALGLAILADGMGGYNAGEVASRMAVEHVRDGLHRWQTQTPRPYGLRQLKRALATCTDEANRAIFDAAHTNPSYAGMGTTLVCLSLAEEGRVIVAHAGDSRAYRLRDGALTQLTRDHSLLQEQVDAGLLTPEQVHVFGYRNFITRALGVEDTVVLDIHDFDVNPGDLYLLCSDGLTDMVDDADIQAVLASSGDLPGKARTLVEWANRNGGRDNVTVLLTEVQTP
ncbi:Stp1/IreP family PP2C-type Ser/Thr phosphatase [Comamonas serinivorans]|uniref:Stp1/IreP family PP2C-type Ser/Thr phosphatase n=1 Tax=Comamonas serinivorans TaxID=1082851 RepID=UPI0026C3A9BB